MNYHALTRRELQALCKEHKIPANKTNVFMAEALTTLLGNGGTKAAEAVSPPAAVKSPPAAANEESVGEAQSDITTDDAEEPNAAKPVKRTAKSKPAKKAVALGPADVSSAVKPATKRTVARSKVSSLANLTTGDTSNGYTKAPVVEKAAKPASRNVKMPAFNAQPAKKVTSGSQSSMSASSASGVSRQASDAEESCMDSGASLSSTDELKMGARPVGKRSSRLLKDVEEKPRVTKMSPTVKRCIVRRAGKAAESQEKLDSGNVKAIVSKIEKALSGEDNGAVVVEGDPAVESDTETATVAQNADSAMHVDVEVEVEAPALESGDNNVTSESEEADPKQIEEPKAEAPKRAGRAKKAAPAAKVKAVKATRTKIAPLQASPPAIQVYCDVEIVDDVVAVETAPMSDPSEEEFDTVPLSPVRDEISDSSALASPVKSPSLALPGDDLGPESPVESKPVVQKAKKGNKKSKDNVDKENPGNPKLVDVPTSLRKLRKQIREVVGSKKGNTAVASPLKDISLNVLTSRRESLSFSFPYQG